LTQLGCCNVASPVRGRVAEAYTNLKSAETRLDSVTLVSVSSARIGRCSSSLAYGALGTASAEPKKAPEESNHQLYGFLTTTQNWTVAGSRKKATPVILRTVEEIDVRINAPTQVALELQRPLPDDALKIVLRDAKEDAIAA
jgi:hypothetical protein